MNRCITSSLIDIEWREKTRRECPSKQSNYIMCRRNNSIYIYIKLHRWTHQHTRCGRGWGGNWLSSCKIYLSTDWIISSHDYNWESVCLLAWWGDSLVVVKRWICPKSLRHAIEITVSPTTQRRDSPNKRSMRERYNPTTNTQVTEWTLQSVHATT